MLEAAMMGIPYAGRIPDFANMQAGGGAGGGGRPVDADLQEQRMLQQEQNAAFQESLDVRPCFEAKEPQPSVTSVPYLGEIECPGLKAK